MSTLAEALAPKSDQLNADDLIAGPRVLKITKARISKEDRATKIVLNYEGDNGKPWKPCKTMGRAMVMAWAITDEAQMVGKSVRVYRDPEVKFGDQGAVGGIRISHMSDIAKPVSVKLTVSQGKKGAFTFAPLVTEVPKPEGPSPDVLKWVDDLIARIQAAPTAEAILAIENEGMVIKRRQWMDDAQPELAARITAAFAAGPFAEGRGDPDFGDQFPDDATQEN